MKRVLSVMLAALVFALLLSGRSSQAGDCEPDSTPPVGRITEPGPGSCNGPASLPIFVQDDFIDDCDPGLDRTYEPASTWETKLLASDGFTADSFGYSVSVDGDIAVIGARDHDDKGDRSGSAYVFRRDGVAWVEEQELLASDGAAGDLFGEDVAVDGDTIVVGAWFDDDNGDASGSAYVFRYDGTAWAEEQKLLASDGDAFDTFGAGVAVDGNTVVIGASSGRAAYVFRFDGTEWVEQQKLVSGDGDSGGSNVAVDGDVTLVSGINSAYVFRFDGTEWVEEQTLVVSDFQPPNSFGSRFDLDGSTVVLGVSGDDDIDTDSGAAYVFRFDGTSWIEEQKLHASDGGFLHRFGTSVSVDEAAILIGAPGVGLLGEGAAYVFQWTGTEWSESRKLMASDGGSQDDLGEASSIEGSSAVVGARRHDANGSDSGSAHVFEEPVPGGYIGHGDHFVTLTARDASGNSAADSVSFTIDSVPPAVELTAPDELTIPTTIPFSDLFTAHDDDGASGDVVRERVLFDECLLFDGLDYGDGDGLLSDELAVLDGTLLCEAIARCGLPEIDEPEVRFEAIDCGGNVGRPTRVIRVVPVVSQPACQAELSLSKDSGSARLSWQPSFPAESYDVIRGDLANLRAGIDSVNLGPVTCVLENTSGNSGSIAAVPVSGGAFFYLIRYHHGVTTSEYGWSSSGLPERPGAGDCAP